jgi:hypothetical protein
VTAKAAPLQQWANFAGEVDRLRMKTSRRKQQEKGGSRSGEEREHCRSLDRSGRLATENRSRAAL